MPEVGCQKRRAAREEKGKRKDRGHEKRTGGNLSGIDGPTGAEATIIGEGNIREDSGEIPSNTRDVDVGLVVQKVTKLVSVASAFCYKCKIDG